MILKELLVIFVTLAKKNPVIDEIFFFSPKIFHSREKIFHSIKFFLRGDISFFIAP